MNTRPLPAWARFSAEILGMAAIYYVVGRVSLLLAIPPGYATAIWPAAGLALAGVVTFGPRICFGVFVGSFFINVWTSLDASSAASIAKSVAVAAGIGLGAALQAQVGALLLRRFAGFPNPLVAQERVLQFIGIGIGSCLVNCTLGSATLWLAGLLRLENLFFSWWTWWVGDSVGVILFAPLALIWIDRSLPIQLRRRFTVSLPIGLMFLVAVAVYVIERQREQKIIAQTFRERTALLTQKLEGDFTDDLEIADFLAGLFTSTNRVAPADFTNFCRRIMAQHRSIESLDWAPEILETQRAGFEAAARQLGFPNFEITDLDAQDQPVRAPGRAEHLPILYAESAEKTTLAPGVDLLAQPILAAAAQQAGDTGRIAVTGRIILTAGAKPRPGFAVLAPVYDRDFDPGAAATTPAQRRSKLRSVALATIRSEDLVGSALQDADRDGIEIRCFDDTGPNAGKIFYSSIQQASELRRGGALHRKASFEVGGHPWRIEYWLTPEYLAHHRPIEAWAVLTGALAFVGLASAFLLVLTGRTAGVEQVVVLRSSELALANEQLRRTSAELQAIFNALPDLTLRLQRDGLILDYRAQSGWVHYFPEEKLRGSKLQKILPSEVAAQVESGIAETLATQKLVVIEYSLQKPAGRREIEGRLVPLGDHELLFVVRDITERRQAEEELRESEARFRGAVEHSAIGCALVALDGRWLQVNRAVCEMVGRTETELLTLTFQDITYPDDLDPDLGNVRRIIAGEISHYHLEKRYIHKDGHIVWVWLTVSLVRHADGTPAYFVSQIQDITQRRAANDQLQASLAEKEVLLKEIHHRVKNNLQVISSLLRIQSGYLKDPADTEILRECETRIQTMAMVHERLYQSGNFAEIDFGGHLRELAALVVRAQSRDPERFRLDLQCASALVSLDDAVPLGLIAAELMINAFKHAFSGRTSGCVRVRFQREADGLILEVADDGVGLPANFNFEQGKTLGLRLIRSLARQLRAEITSESGSGATIRVRTPQPFPEPR